MTGTSSDFSRSLSSSSRLRAICFMAFATSPPGTPALMASMICSLSLAKRRNSALWPSMTALCWQHRSCRPSHCHRGRRSAGPVSKRACCRQLRWNGSRQTMAWTAIGNTISGKKLTPRWTNPWDPNETPWSTSLIASLNGLGGNPRMDEIAEAQTTRIFTDHARTAAHAIFDPRFAQYLSVEVSLRALSYLFLFISYRWIAARTVSSASLTPTQRTICAHLPFSRSL